MEIFLFQLGVLFAPFILARFVSQKANTALDDEQRAQLVESFANAYLYGGILFFIPFVFLYNQIFYLTLYTGLFVLATQIFHIFKVHRLGFPALFMRQFLLAKAIAFCGLAGYFIIFFYYYL